MPAKLSRQRVSSTLLSKSLTSPLRLFSSGGNNPLFMKRSKCSLRIRSMPDGKEGKMVVGRFIDLL